MTDRLQEILSATRADLDQKKKEVPFKNLEKEVAKTPPPRRFIEAIASSRRIHVIAEIKRRSPSAGPLRPHLDPSDLAKEYEAAGASALSVLTNPTHFGGHLKDLQAARGAVSLPVLRKDFIIDSYQIYESRAAGADAVLLIVGALENAELAALAALSVQLGMAPLIEIHDRSELERALALKPAVIGINNRNLKDLSVDLLTTRTLKPLIPEGTVVVSESGYGSPDQIQSLQGLGVNAVLVGESLLRQDSPARTLQAFVKAGRQNG